MLGIRCIHYYIECNDMPLEMTWYSSSPYRRGKNMQILTSDWLMFW